jgi:hypothetical protein
MSWRAQNRSQDAKIRSIRGTRSDCLKLLTYGIQRYIKDRYSVMDWPNKASVSSGGSIFSFCIAN